MRAEEARKIADECEGILDRVIDTITFAADNGNYQIPYTGLNERIIIKLIELGYQVKAKETNEGLKSHVISW